MTRSFRWLSTEREAFGLSVAHGREYPSGGCRVLRSRGLGVLDVKEQGWHGCSDRELPDEAYRLGRIVLTHDGDFGTLALLDRRPVVGVVRIRPGHIRSEVTIRAVEQLLALSLDPSLPFLGPEEQ